MKSSHQSYDILKVNCEVFLILKVSFILESFSCFLGLWKKKIDLEGFFPGYRVSVLFCKTIIFFFFLLSPRCIGVFSAKNSIAGTFNTCWYLKRLRHTHGIARGRVELAIQCCSSVNPSVFLHRVLEKHLG